MQKGTIGVASENLFPIIKKFLYSDHDIFLREIVSNAVDATQKLKTLASVGKYSGNMEAAKIEVKLDKEAGTITVSDMGIGMTADEIEKYINQIAFSGANEFVEKYENDANAIIGHFGLGFYSSFMVSDKVEIITRSYQDGANAVKWSCDGSPNYEITEVEKEGIGTDIVMYVNEESKEFLEDARLSEILNKYCKFLPVPVIFGKEQEWKDGKMEDTDKDKQVNDVAPAWTKKPVDLKEEDYQNFYRQLYPMGDDPLFNIHLNVDYPFNLTGILYFPKLKNNVEIQKNKIQLYCNQVFVTDSVEGIVPEFLTLLHGVIDSPDIPLNVSRSYLQSDGNVKKISSHITKKVADRLAEIFKNDRKQFEEKWDDLKIFIEYGMLSEEKFYDRAIKYFMVKNTDGKFYTLDEYETAIKDNQTDKENNVICLYTNDEVEQFSFIEAAKNKGYDVLVMDSVLSTPMVNKLEEKFPNRKFVRVDSDVVEKLIQKDDAAQVEISAEDQSDLSTVFQAVCPAGKGNFIVDFQNMGETAAPMVITRNEFMRRMKDMSQFQGGGMNFYGELPDSYNLVVNAEHPLVKQVMEAKSTDMTETLKDVNYNLAVKQAEKEGLVKAKEGKKEEEVPQAEKEQLESVEKELETLSTEKREKLTQYGKENKLSKQLVDLALLANGMLKGEDLNAFVKRSIDLIK
ncbi:molecular chaperone HtpG [Prolixibacteraceae bacterium JC049]|nr:molecular chaperone HtpG [Prolixibacteraceae bacterium JC049]